MKQTLDEMSKAHNWNGIDKMAVKLLTDSIVTDQSAKFTDGEGNKYNSEAKAMEFDNMVSIIVTKNGKQLAVLIYNNETNEEGWM